METTRVLLLRHAESSDATVFHGAESDVGLSERGRRQAEAIAPVLAAMHPDAIISSGMRRALQTAEPIARACDREIIVEPALHERRVGALSGTSFQAADGVWPETLRRWMAGDVDYAPEGAESFAAIRARVLPIWERLTTVHHDRTIAIICHGVVCKVLLLSLLEGYDLGSWNRIGPIGNVALNELARANGVWRLVRLNFLPPAVTEIT
jgi:broad specificity phosphatase PhoE